MQNYSYTIFCHSWNLAFTWFWVIFAHIFSFRHHVPIFFLRKRPLDNLLQNRLHSSDELLLQVFTHQKGKLGMCLKWSKEKKYKCIVQQLNTKEYFAKNLRPQIVPFAKFKVTQLSMYLHTYVIKPSRETGPSLFMLFTDLEFKIFQTCYISHSLGN